MTSLHQFHHLARRAMAASAVCFILIGCGSSGGTMDSNDPPPPVVDTTPRILTFDADTPTPTLAQLTGAGGNDMWTIEASITGSPPALDINGVINGAGNTDEVRMVNGRSVRGDEVRLVADGVVNSIDFGSFMAGNLSLQDIETITLDGGTVNTTINASGETTAGITFNLILGRVGPMDPATDFVAITGSDQNDTFIIAGDITEDSPALEINGRIDGAGGGQDELQLNTGAVVASILVRNTVLTSGGLDVQNIEIITLDGGTVNGSINAIRHDAPTGITFNLRSGTINSSGDPVGGIGGSLNNDTFIISGDITGDSPALDINGEISGNGIADQDEVRVVAGGVVSAINFADFLAGQLNLQNVEVITIDGGTVTGSIIADAATAIEFNLVSGRVGPTTLADGSTDAAITGSGRTDAFIIAGDITDANDPPELDINGLLQGGDSSQDEVRLVAGSVVSAINFDSFTPGQLNLEGVETIRLDGGTVGNITGSAGNERFFIMGDLISGDLNINGIIDGAGSMTNNAFMLGEGGVVNDIAVFTSTNPAPGNPDPGNVHLQNIPSITLTGGTVRNITGSAGDEQFFISGDLTSDDFNITGIIDGGVGADTFTLGRGGTVSEDGVVRDIVFSASNPAPADAAMGDVHLQNIETITLNNGTVNGNIDASDVTVADAATTGVTFTLRNGTITGDVIGTGGVDTFTIGVGITINGMIDGGDGMDALNLVTGFNPTAANFTGGVLTLTFIGGGRLTLRLVSIDIFGFEDILTRDGPMTQTFATGTPDALTGGGADDTWTITGDATGNSPTLTIDGVIDGAGNTDEVRMVDDGVRVRSVRGDELQLNTGAVVTSVAFSTTAPTGGSGVVNLQNIETITIDGGTVTSNIIAGDGNAGIIFNLISGTINSSMGFSGGIAGTNNHSDIFNLYSTITINGVLTGGLGNNDVLRYMGAPAGTAFAGRGGLAADPNITDRDGSVSEIERQEADATITSLGAGGAADAGGAPAGAGLRGLTVRGIEVLGLSPALNLYGAMSDALMQFGAQTAQGFALADLNLATGRATSLVSKDSPFTKGRIWAHKITHSGNGKGSIGLGLTGLTARAESDYDYEMSLTQHGFDAPLATTRLGAFNLRAVSHTMTGVIETNVAEANVSGYGAGVALLWNSGAVARQRAKRARAPIISAVSASAHHHHGLSAHITSLAGAYEVEAHTSPLNPRAVVNEVSEGSFSAINAVVSAGVADTRKLGHSLVLRTTADITWQTLSLDDFTETGQDGIIINFDKATRFTARVGAGLESEHWFSDVAFVHETSSGGTLSSGLSQDYRQDDGTAIEMKLGGKIADLATGLTLKAYAGLRTSLISSDSIDPSAHLALNWRF